MIPEKITVLSESHGQWEDNEIEKEVRRLKKKSGQS
jgi:hypothetical protein